MASGAAGVGVSREQVTRTFTRHVGEPPARWFQRQRIAQARAMLTNPASSSAEVSQCCGFPGCAHSR